MGTLEHQLNREKRRMTLLEQDNYIVEIKELSKKHKLTVSEVTEILKVIQYDRFNEIYIDNGDIFDEQMSGLAKLLSVY